ncbi:MAG: DUF1684 domain-containing protein [Geodermatophilaceae bacterium]|jgi:uncharacterized protein (DUF1684 family)|nr:DUF1684 domain-containing protein [Geodermatophilaceae bacterium]
MSATVLDWRRTVGDLYRQVRECEQPEQGFDVWREGRDRLFAQHPESPLEAPAKVDFAGLPYAPYDPAYRFVVRIDTDIEPARLDVPTQDDEVVRLDRIGRVELGDLGSLDVWWLAQYGGGLFLPMRDTTAGRSTYGAGRYLLDTVKGADLGAVGTQADSVVGATIVVDLNFAYHPSCAYSPRWVCPLAQAGNRLDVDVPVGEQYPAEGWPHAGN